MGLKMAKSRKKPSPQVDLAFRVPVLRETDQVRTNSPACPIYYPKTGPGLRELALRLGPILKRAGWEVHVVAGDGGDEFLQLQNKSGHSRRVSPEELVAWQALLPELLGREELFSETGSNDGKE